MASIKCGSCEKIHSSINEVKSCFAQNKNFVEEATITAPVTKVVKTEVPVVGVIKKASDPVVKDYETKTFNTKQEAEAFVQNTPNSKLNGTVKVKSVNTWMKDTKSYQMVVTKTYTVIVKK